MNEELVTCTHGISLTAVCDKCGEETLTCQHGEPLKDYCYRCAARATTEDFTDAVKRPVHYTQGKIECWDAIESALTPEEWRGYLKGVMICYLWRERLKGGDEDMAKVAAYLKRGGFIK